MYSPIRYAIPSVALVSLLSLIGLAVIALPGAKLKKIIFVAIALATGSLFADAFLELLPEAYRVLSASTGLYVLGGILLFFVLEHFLSWKHEHAVPGAIPEYKPIGYINLAADAIHNFTDGLIIGVSYLAGLQVGIATTAAVIFHEIPHEAGNFFVLLYAGFSKKQALLLNCLTGVVARLGTLMALYVGRNANAFAKIVVPVAAGGFIYIAGSDLLPELTREVNLKRSVSQFLALIAGIGVIACLRLVG